MEKIAILIPVFNHLEFTKKCVQTLASQLSESIIRHCEYSIVIVDDGSTDGTSEWLKDNYPEITILNGDGNLWWSGGINEGARYAIAELNADFVLLWNNDIIPAQNYFTELDLIAKSIDNQTIVGSKIFRYNEDNDNIIWSFGGIFNARTGKKYLIGYDEPDTGQYSIIQDVDWLPGMGTMVHVDVISRIGLWNEKDFPQYHGDSDFTFRAKVAGCAIRVFPQLMLWNDKTTSGLKHGGSFKGVLAALTDIRSNSNFKKNYQFYKQHSTSILAYKALIEYYTIYFLSFLKWKFLSNFGIKKNN